MAEFKLFGRFIAMSEVKEVASSTAGNPPMKKCEVYMDCTRRDMYTGQQVGNENKVVLEFGGEKTIDKLKALQLRKDDVVAVDFSIVGSPYKDKQTGKTKVFTSIRCYDINVTARAGQQVQQQATPQPAPQPVPVPQPEPVQEPVPQQNDDAGQEPLPF